jgi:hypothetical protein
MKKYLVLSFLFLITVSQVLAKGVNETTGSSSDKPEVENSQSETTADDENASARVTNAPTKKTYITPSGNQVKNQVEVETKNQGTDKQIKAETNENEQLNEEVVQSFTKVSDQVHQLIETTGAKGGIGQEVKSIAQSQEKLQDDIKTDFEKLNSRGGVAKFFIGSDKKLTKSLEQKMEQNQLMIQQLEQLKLSTNNEGELQQLQETIDLMVYQNEALQNKVEIESKSKGVFGWLKNIFDWNK